MTRYNRIIPGDSTDDFEGKVVTPEYKSDGFLESYQTRMKKTSESLARFQKISPWKLTLKMKKKIKLIILK